MEPPDPMLHQIKDRKRRYWLTCEWWLMILLFSPVIIAGFLKCVYDDWKVRKKKEM